MAQPLRPGPLGEFQVIRVIDDSRSIRVLAEQKAIEMPIADEVYEILFNGRSAARATSDLMQRPLRSE